MKRWHKVLFSSLLAVVILVLGGIYLSQLDLIVLNPKGIIGVKERDLMWICTLLMMIVIVPVFVMTLFIVWKYRADNPKHKYKPDWNHSTVAEIIWWGIPCIIVVILSVLNWIACYDLDPYKPIENGKKPITIQVVALNWKWLFIYPEEKIATVNFLQVPVGVPINFVITADAPMNSFWIPELGGQIFAMSGMRTELHLIADHKGEFRGVSANISGKGFSGMTFFLKAGSDEDYNQWLSQVQNSPQSLDVSSYKQLAEPSENNPVAYYRLGDAALFDWVLMREMGSNGK
jgi:cytochrome o ubiquinol oxidase subunit 2